MKRSSIAHPKHGFEDIGSRSPTDISIRASPTLERIHTRNVHHFYRDNFRTRANYTGQKMFDRKTFNPYTCGMTRAHTSFCEKGSSRRMSSNPSEATLAWLNSVRNERASLTQTRRNFVPLFSPKFVFVMAIHLSIDHGGTVYRVPGRII